MTARPGGPGRFRAALLDVDFTLCKPGPLLGADGYTAAGARRGLSLDPEKYEDARRAAVEDIQHHPELDYDVDVWIRFTEDVVRGMGGTGPDATAVAIEIVNAWEHSGNFELYEDAAPVMRELRRLGLRIGLVSNTSRHRLPRLIDAFSLDVDAWISSGSHGKVKPSPTIFLAMLDMLDVEPTEAVMVGDQIADDVEGARALGITAYLIDREGLYPDRTDTIPDLFSLPALLGG
jgi:HAD superfamily hydrolase (TIGR01549 family)